MTNPTYGNLRPRRGPTLQPARSDGDVRMVAFDPEGVGAGVAR
jgi:hypothetical protein